ncbi:LacI family transcriptional regulator [Labrys miyagiensis]|uniref:LacI family transcriptional regulator n=1 Tax=Labrys miyagiensis TaxID=346912 RepID=A0ABQ6CJ05_9HYPH|nr:LacI family transcriptional regulator [Labrys miyagiensis]
MTQPDDRPAARAKRVGPPTIRDVARVAGVSIGTISAVINGSGAVAPDTRRHVLSCIAELGFEPNNAARTLKRGRISSIGLIVPDLDNPFFAAVAEGVQQAAAGEDVLMVLCITGSSAEREDYYAQILRSKRLDGVVYLSGSGMPSASLLQLARRGAVVFVDERLPGVDAPFVTAQNLAGARTLAKSVLAVGHRRLAIAGGPPRLWTSEQRLAGYREAIASAGLDPDAVECVAGDYSERSGYEIASRFLALDPATRPTALLCANDLMAMGAIRRCRELKLRIPADISITGFDDIPSSEFLDPPLTTVTQPGRQMGEAAAQLLMQAVGLAKAGPAQIEFATAVNLRGSVANI